LADHVNRVGLDILFSRRFVWIGSLVGILAVVGLIAYLLLMPKTGLQTATQAVQENFGAPIGETNTVSYNLRHHPNRLIFTH